MTIKAKLLCAAAASALAAFAATAPAQALTSQECSAKYQAAKSGGTLNGMKWNDFRKAQCGADGRAGYRARRSAAAGRRSQAEGRAPHGGTGISERACELPDGDQSEIR